MQMNTSDDIPQRIWMSWRSMLTMILLTPLTPLAALAAGILKGILLALPVMLLWNRVLARVVEVPSIDFLTAFLLLLLFQMLGPVKLSVGHEKR